MPREGSETVHRLELGHGLELRCAMTSLDDTIEITLTHRDHVLLDKVFSAESSEEAFKLDGRFVRADGRLTADVFGGELSWSGHLEARLPWRRWHRILDVDHGVFARFAPGVGEVSGSPDVFEPVVEDPRFGRSQLCTPAILRIFVDDEGREIADVGKIVKQRMFDDRPPFVFNTVCCVGGVPDGTPGLYPDPTSVWFNVFFGFYQLDCPKSQWSRPFGYRSADRAASELEPEDVVRLGKSDWNWFSNWMYGVPAEFIEPYSSPDVGDVEVVESPPQTIGSKVWHGMTLRGVEVASCYQSDAEGAGRLTTNTIIDDVWRNAFGLPSPQPDWQDSFMPTRLIAQVDMSYWEDDDTFHTMIFGGTCDIDAPPEFLTAQMEAVRKVIASSYPDRGFDPA